MKVAQKILSQVRDIGVILKNVWEFEQNGHKTFVVVIVTTDTSGGGAYHLHHSTFTKSDWEPCCLQRHIYIFSIYKLTVKVQELVKIKIADTISRSGKEILLSIASDLLQRLIQGTMKNEQIEELYTQSQAMQRQTPHETSPTRTTSDSPKETQLQPARQPSITTSAKKPPLFFLFVRNAYLKHKNHIYNFNENKTFNLVCELCGKKITMKTKELPTVKTKCNPKRSTKALILTAVATRLGLNTLKEFLDIHSNKLRLTITEAISRLVARDEDSDEDFVSYGKI